MKISKIEPIYRTSMQQYAFIVTLDHGVRGTLLELHSTQLLDFQTFRTHVLAATGRLYGDPGTYQNWALEVAKHLDDYWRTHQDKSHGSTPLPPSCDKEGDKELLPYSSHEEDHHHQVVS